MGLGILDHEDLLNSGMLRKEGKLIAHDREVRAEIPTLVRQIYSVCTTNSEQITDLEEIMTLSNNLNINVIKDEKSKLKCKEYKWSDFKDITK